MQIELWERSLEYIDLFILVFARMSGMILLNPLLGRRNMPLRVNMGLILGLALIITPTLSPASIAAFGEFEMIFAIIKEVALGLLCGFVFQIFYAMLLYAGEIMDLQFGMSMAKVMDPSSNVQMSLSGTYLILFFFFYILATDTHLTMIQIFASSYQIIPAGAVGLSLGVAEYMIQLFVAIMGLAIKLTLPFIACELIMEAAIGILMRVVPQIHVFVINIQLKVILGFIMLILFSHPIASFIDRYIGIMISNIKDVLMVTVG